MNLNFLKDNGCNLNLLGDYISQKTESFSVSASLSDNELSYGFKDIDLFWHYQVLYLALTESHKLVLTTYPENKLAYIPITNIYDYNFPRTGETRDEMDYISRKYEQGFKWFVYLYNHKFSVQRIVNRDISYIFTIESK